MKKQDIEAKINELVGKMTLEEKVSMCHGAGLFRTEGVERLGIPPLVMSDGPMGVRKDYKNDRWEDLNQSDDYSTYLPCYTALAATWNPELAYECGEILGEETRGRGKDMILAPGINIHRSPLCGRNFEYMSEDPYLVSKMVVPFVKGIQKSDVSCCVKHFAMNNQETRRMEVSVEADDRALYEIYLPGFHAAVKEGKAYSVMAAYNKFRGLHCCHNEYLLKDILKKSWEFDGVVVSDWNAVHDTVKAANAGLDIEMRVDNNFDDFFMAKPLIQKVKEGKVSESEIDDKVRRILRLMFKLKMFDKAQRSKGSYNTEAHRNGTLKAARESIVLLKNNKKLLPLCEDKLKHITVIGENAIKQHADAGDSAQIKALYEITPLLGLKMKLGGNTKVDFYRGYSPLETERAKLRHEAVRAAEASETVILFVGLNHEYDLEGRDRKDMKLPYEQDELIKEVLKANKNTIVVIVSGSPVEMGEWIYDASTVMQSWYNGMEGGTAIAEVLLGEVNPSGKLPISFPKSHRDCSAHCVGEFPGEETAAYKESIFVGYRYYDTYNVETQFPFGHGLSYTDFKYSDLKLSISEDKDDVKIKVSFKVENAGAVEGKEIAQVYVSDIKASLKRPEKELKGFKKVNLKSGEVINVEIELDKTSLAFYDDRDRCWKVEPGEFKVLIGSSSRDIRITDKFNISKELKYLW